MKKYISKKKNGKAKKDPSGLWMRVSAVMSVVFIVGVGILCTSPSKAAEDAPYFPPDIEDYTDDPAYTEPEETTAPPETLPDLGTGDGTVTVSPVTDGPGTETDADTSDPGTTVTDTVPETTAPAPETTTAPETTAPAPSQTPEGKQTYREYNGREFASNETFVGEYKTDRVSVGVSHVQNGDVSYFICDIKVKSPTDLHTAFANGKISQRAYTSKIAASVGAGFAVNGDFCGFHSSGIIIRERGLYRNKKSSDDWDLCYMNRYGDLITCRNDKQDGKKLVDDGVIQSWCFGPTLVSDYKALTKEQFNTPGLSRSAREPRTAIGQIDELHYIILVVDAQRVKNGAGWTTVGGMSFSDLAKTFEGLGCKTAYNLDGGGSTTMWLNGKIANKPCMEGERQVSDIIYLK